MQTKKYYRNILIISLFIFKINFVTYNKSNARKRNLMHHTIMLAYEKSSFYRKYRFFILEPYGEGSMRDHCDSDC